ncbi:hypothetical protein KDK_31040 [Dictyobacter kobayashii]|uniref:Uncharacterized protein n=1 Tax=Dictyobacter kobayashii TaxID=2014872 RepID=A0A402AJS0_9CHLR|nr:hypothetical protein KDK_31040 [Dictyobacter kobayashii]
MGQWSFTRLVRYYRMYANNIEEQAHAPHCSALYAIIAWKQNSIGNICVYQCLYFDLNKE